jgi:hypothetical protein
MSENEQLYELTKTLAVEMTARTGDLWRANIDPERWTTQIYTATAWITLSIYRTHLKPTRLKAWSSVPKGINPLSDKDVMSVDATRTPSAIAADIHRRLYAHAQEYLKDCSDAQAIQDTRNRKEQLKKNLLSRYLTKGYYDNFHSENGKINKAEIRSNDVEMKLSVTMTEALKICRLLQGA